MDATAPRARYQNLLRAVARSGTRGAPILLFLLSTVTRHHELLHGHVHRDGDHLCVDPEGAGASSRTVALPKLAAALLRDAGGEASAALDVPPQIRGAVIAALRAELVELETDDAIELEQLPLIACEALLAAAPDAARRQAVLAYAGIGPHGAAARRLRAEVLPEGLRWVADTLDELAAEAGFTLTSTAARTA